MKTEEQIAKGKAISGFIAFWCFVGMGVIGIVVIILGR